MNATDKSLHAQFLNETAQVDPATTQPFAKSRKIYVEGSNATIPRNCRARPRPSASSA